MTRNPGDRSAQVVSRADLGAILGLFSVLAVALVVSFVFRQPHRHDRDELAVSPGATWSTMPATDDATTTTYTPRSTVPLTEPPAATAETVVAGAAGATWAGDTTGSVGGPSGPIPQPAVAIAAFDPPCGPTITVTVSITADPRAQLLSVTLRTSDQTAAMAPVGGDLWQATVNVPETTQFVVTIHDAAGRTTTLTSVLSAC